MELSVVIPMFNEEEGVKTTIEELRKTLSVLGNKEWELIAVNDGSLDNTLEVLEDVQKDCKELKIVSYSPNVGRGRALKKGFQAATGNYVVSIDADLSYSADHILKIYNTLLEHPQTDVVLGSAYMKGGKTENVPLKRLLISKWGNIFLRFFMGGGIKTYTCVLRGYRKKVLETLDLGSDDKNIHLEILAKLLILGYKIEEIPAVLKARQKSKSKFKFKKTAYSHLLFSFYQKPIIIFIFIGLLSILSSFIMFLMSLKLYAGDYNFLKLCMLILIPLLFVTGITFILFGAISILILNSRTEIYKIHRTLLSLRKEADGNIEDNENKT